MTTPTIADLDGDGVSEILIGRRGGCELVANGTLVYTPGAVHCIDSRGEELWNRSFGSVTAEPQLYDNDGDGEFEIRAGAGEVTYVDGKHEITHMGQWYFVAVTVHNDGKLAIYVNGEYDSSGSVTAGMPGRVCIGRGAGDDGGSGESFFDGILDEVMVFNRALAAKEIKQIHEFQKGALR